MNEMTTYASDLAGMVQRGMLLSILLIKYVVPQHDYCNCKIASPHSVQRKVCFKRYNVISGRHLFFFHLRHMGCFIPFLCL